MYANFDDRKDLLEVWLLEFDSSAFTKGKRPDYKFFVKNRDEKVIDFFKKVAAVVQKNPSVHSDHITKLANMYYKHPNVYIKVFDDDEQDWAQYPIAPKKDFSNSDLDGIELDVKRGKSKFDPIPWLGLVPTDIKAQKERIDKSDKEEDVFGAYPFEIVDGYVRAKIRWYFDKSHPYNVDEKPIFFQLIKGTMWGVKYNAEKEKKATGDYATGRIKSYRRAFHKTKEMVYTAIENSGLDPIFQEILKGSENGFGEYASDEEREMKASAANTNALLSLPKEEFLEKIDLIFGNNESFKRGLIATYESKQRDRAFAEKKGLEYIDLVNINQANAASIWKAALTNKEILKRDKEEKAERGALERGYSLGIPKKKVVVKKPKLDKTYSAKDSLVESLNNILQKFVLKEFLKGDKK